MMSSLSTDDTICAVATPPGEGGIGVIRISGSDAIRLANQFFFGRDLQTMASHRVVYGKFVDPESGEVVDEIMCAVMRAPRSYTGEDVVELSGHGNPRLLARMVSLLVRGGARNAGPGEFTKRAFLNGKLDLTQAESVMDLVRARTAPAMEAAVEQLHGKLGRYLKSLRAEILSVLSPIEAGIDFPEEDVPDAPRWQLLEQVSAILAKVTSILISASSGRIFREGASAVIAGKPNVGKSSLLNAFLREGRAIVTEIPGTTRDTVEEWADVRGLPIKFVDTAGIRDTEDKVEQIGIMRSKEALARGDLFLLVLDRASPLESDDLNLLELAGRKRSIVVLNKMDLTGPLAPADVRKRYAGPVVCVSALTSRGLDELEAWIVEELGKPGERTDLPLVTHLRHQEALERAAEFLQASIQTLLDNFPLDLVALDLRGASEAIGEITGQHYTEDLIRKIFNEFCIGK